MPIVHGLHRRLAVMLLVIAGIGIAVSGLASQPLVSMIALCFAASSFISAQPLFWTFPDALSRRRRCRGRHRADQFARQSRRFRRADAAHGRRARVCIDERGARAARRGERAGRARDRRVRAPAEGGALTGRPNPPKRHNHKTSNGVRPCPCQPSGKCAPSPSGAAAPIITTRAPITGSTITSPRRWRATLSTARAGSRSGSTCWARWSSR